jgi:hypothetical protein
VYEKAGFEHEQAFQRSGDSMEFVILVRQSDLPDTE